MSNAWLITNQQCPSLITLRFFDHVPGTVGEDAIRPLSGVHVYMSQQLLSGHGLRIHCVLLHLPNKKKVNWQGTQGRISLILKMSLFRFFYMLNNTGTQTVHNVILEDLYYITFSSYSIKFKRGGSPCTHHFSCLAESRPEHPPQCGLACSAWPDNNYAHTLS